MAIIKIILGILVVVAGFTIPSLILAIRYVKERKEKGRKKKDKAEATIDKAEKLTRKELWWEYFKPLAAIPVAWYLYHLIFYLILPDVARAIWDLHWHYLMVLELSVIALNSIINKDTPFKERTSRKLMVATYVQTFIMAGIIIIFRIGWSETATNLNRAMLYSLVSSEVELTAENIEKRDKKHKAEPFLTELDRLSQESEKRPLSKLELARLERLKEAVKKIHMVPDEKKIDWQRLWPFSKPAQARGPERRHLLGILKPPADGRTIDQDTNGQKLFYKKGERIQLWQFNSPPEPLTFVNRSSPSWTRKRRICTSGPATEDGKVELRATGGKPVTVQVRIIPGRS